MNDLAQYVDDLVHEPTQVHDDVVDLTAASIWEVGDPGRIDFGGDELEPADTIEVETDKRYLSDDYGWWDLTGGQYLVAYNESLSPPGRTRLVVQPRRELRQRGAFHPTLHCRDLGRVPLAVPAGGIRIKENARISTVVSLDTE